MDRDLDSTAGLVDESFGDLDPVCRREHHALSRRAEREHPVDFVPYEKVDVWPDRVRVEALVAERCDGGGDGSLQHRPSLSSSP